MQEDLRLRNHEFDKLSIELESLWKDFTDLQMKYWDNRKESNHLMVQKEGLERDYKKVEKTLLDQQVMIKNLEANQDKMNQCYYDLKNQFNQLTAQNQRREESLQRQKEGQQRQNEHLQKENDRLCQSHGLFIRHNRLKEYEELLLEHTLLKTQVEALKLKGGKREQWWTLVQDVVQQDIKDAIAHYRADEELDRHKLQAYLTAYPNFKYSPPEKLDAFTSQMQARMQQAQVNW